MRGITYQKIKEKIMITIKIGLKEHTIHIGWPKKY